jgi:hypothetical protein
MAEFNDTSSPAVFGEYDVDGAQLTSAQKYGLLRELWLTQIKAHADEIGAGAFRVALNVKLPESRFDFGNRSHLFFSKRSNGMWPDLPENPGPMSEAESPAPLGFGEDPALAASVPTLTSPPAGLPQFPRP